MDIKNLEMN